MSHPTGHCPAGGRGRLAGGSGGARLRGQGQQTLRGSGVSVLGGCGASLPRLPRAARRLPWGSPPSRGLWVQVGQRSLSTGSSPRYGIYTKMPEVIPPRESMTFEDDLSEVPEAPGEGAQWGGLGLWKGKLKINS